MKKRGVWGWAGTFGTIRIEREHGLKDVFVQILPTIVRSGV